jgi:hypothetical protein
MQNKKLGKIFKVFILSLFVIGEFFGFGLVQKAHAACSYNIKSFATDKQTYTSTETVNFTSVLEVSSDISSCIKSLRFKYRLEVYELVSNEGATYYNKNNKVFKEIGVQNATLNGVSVENKFSYPLSRINFNEEVPNPSKLTFAVDVTDNGYIYDSSILSSQNNTRLSVNVGGGSQGGGTGFTLKLLAGPYKSEYKYPDDKLINIGISLSNQDAQKVTYNVDVITKLNGNVYGTLAGRNGISLGGSGLTQDMDLEPIKGFKNGQNDIAVTVTASGRPDSIVATGKLTLFATGIGNLASVSISPQQVKLGDEVTLTVTGAPSGWQQGVIYINDSNSNYISFGNSSPFKFKADASKGFIDNKPNNLLVEINNSGNRVPLVNGGKLVLNVGNSGTGSGTGAGTGGITDPATRTGWDCKNNFDEKHCLYNPLPSGDLIAIFLIITKGTMAIIGIFAVVFIVIGGFRMIIFSGDEEAVTAAKKSITWSIIGLVVAMLSFSMVAIVQSLLRAKVDYGVTETTRK